MPRRSSIPLNFTRYRRRQQAVKKLKASIIGALAGISVGIVLVQLMPAASPVAAAQTQDMRVEWAMNPRPPSATMAPVPDGFRPEDMAMEDLATGDIDDAGSVNVYRGTAASAVSQHRFTFCHSGGGGNCVVDGDTVWIDGEKIRVADIDAPETHPPRCADEAAKGAAATRRLHALLNQGPFDLVTNGRDRDRYGRALRVIVRNGRSLGDQLVTEGLARQWTGRREPWC